MAAYIMAYLPLLLLSMLLYRCLENSYVMLVLLAIFVGIYALLIESFVLKNQVIKIFLKRK
jgi:hypothetical protein